MSIASPIWSSFNAGELSPLLQGRVDLPQYQKGAEICLNFIPTVQGPVMRRGGTALCGATANPNAPSLLIRFSRSPTESYLLEFYAGGVRFWFNGSLVTASGSVYSLTSPYQQADLFDSTGQPQVWAAESVDQIFLVHPNYPVQILSFFGPSNWTLTAANLVDGPWMPANTNQNASVSISGGVSVGSTITILSNTQIFQAGHVGSLFRITQNDLSQIKPWAPGQMTPTIASGVQRRSGYCTYTCANASAGVPPPSGTQLLFVQTGGNTPIHTTGSAWDGDQSTTIDPIGGPGYFSTGVQWIYEDCGYGVAVITSVVSSQIAQATILRQFPVALLTQPSWQWEMGAFNAVNGYPSKVTFWNGRLILAAGAWVYGSVSGDYQNFADLQLGQLLADSAFSQLLLSDQVNNVLWMQPTQYLLVGTTGNEFVISAQSESLPFGPNNIQCQSQSAYGSRAVAPVRVELNTVYVQAGGLKVREFSYIFYNNAYTSNDLTPLSEHITNGGIVCSAWAKTPYTIIWYVLGNGNLVGFTYNPKEEVRSWHRHDLGAVGKAVNVCSIPSADGTVDDVYVVSKRYPAPVVGVAPLAYYYVEKLIQPFTNLPGTWQHDAFYVDCGLTLNNTVNNVLTITGNGWVHDAQNVFFQVSAYPYTFMFQPTDVGRYIDFDWISTTTGSDGLTYPQAVTARAQITQYVSGQTVEATILSPFPQAQFVASTMTIQPNQWRMSVTSISSNNFPVVWNGGTLSVLADGACQTDINWSGGTITLDNQASIVQLGFKSPAVLKTMRVEAGDQEGSSQGKLKRIWRATIRLVNSLGGKIGRDMKNLVTITKRNPNQPANVVASISSGDTTRLSFKGQWNRSGQVMIVQDQPLPLTVDAVMVELETSEQS